MGIRHAYIAEGANDPTKQVSKDRWNEDHEIDDDSIPGAKIISLSYGKLADLPASFPPAAHGHTIAEVSGLASALTAKQDALGFTPENTAQKGAANGYAGLDGTGKVPAAQLPAGASPAGADEDLQIKSGSGFAAPSGVATEGGQLKFPAIAPPAAPASGVKLYNATKVGQRDGLVMLFSSGRESRPQEDLADFQTLRFQPAPNNAALVGDGTLPLTITGTATAGAVQTTNLFLKWPRIEARVATPATNAIAGFRGGGGVVTAGRDANAPGGFRFVSAWGPVAGFTPPTTHRAMCGLTASTAAPTDVEPSTLTDGIWMGWDAADANVQIMHNDASGAATKIDLGASFPVPTVSNTDVYMLELFSPNGLTQSVGYRVSLFQTQNRVIAAETTGTITTNLPAVTTLLSPRLWASAGGTSSAIGIALYGIAIGLRY